MLVVSMTHVTIVLKLQLEKDWGVRESDLILLYELWEAYARETQWHAVAFNVPKLAQLLHTHPDTAKHTQTLSHTLTELELITQGLHCNFLRPLIV